MKSLFTTFGIIVVAFVCIHTAAADWASSTKLLDEMGGVGPGFMKNRIDCKQVCIKNDAQNLSMYIKLEPSISEYFKARKTTTEICTIYINSDGDPKTGCKDVEGLGFGMITGYETAVTLSVEQINFAQGNKPAEAVAALSVRSAKAQANEFEVKKLEIDSLKNPESISHGSDGVKFSIPLSDLSLTKNAEISLLFAEKAHIFDSKGFSKSEYMVK